MLPITITNYSQNHLLFENETDCPDQVAQLVGVSSCPPKGCMFNFHSGHIRMLQVQSLVRVHVGGNQSMFLSLSKKLIYPRVRIKKERKKEKETDF